MTRRRYAATIPAEALTKRLDWEVALGAAALAAVLLLVSQGFWKLRLRRYSGTSA